MVATQEATAVPMRPVWPMHGVASGGMPTADGGDRARPMAESPMQLRRTLGEPVADFGLLGTPEGSLALPRIWR